jgi:hypothetical protein
MWCCAAARQGDEPAAGIEWDACGNHLTASH